MQNKIFFYLYTSHHDLVLNCHVQLLIFPVDASIVASEYFSKILHSNLVACVVFRRQPNDVDKPQRYDVIGHDLHS